MSKWLRGPSPESVSDLQLTREREKQTVNSFLEQHHPLGGVHGWKAVFSARYGDCVVAMIVIGRPNAPDLDDGTCIEINRLARRDDRPDNTCSWLIARARKWCYLEGYDEIVTYAGVAGNYGTAYAAAGFKNPGGVTMTNGSGWTNRPGREEWEDYEQRKWVFDLTEYSL